MPNTHAKFQAQAHTLQMTLKPPKGMTLDKFFEPVSLAYYVHSEKKVFENTVYSH